MNEIISKKINEVINFFEKNISFGWKDINGNFHYDDADGFDSLYISMSNDETLKKKIGSCHEQVNLMKSMFDSAGIDSTIFCCKVYKSTKDKNPKYLHSFIILKIGKEYNMLEHAQKNKKVIYKSAQIEDLFNIVKRKYENKLPCSVKKIYMYDKLPSGITYKELDKFLTKELIDYQSIF